jgi:glucose-1-phosphate thymidylyltransferase
MGSATSIKNAVILARGLGRRMRQDDSSTLLDAAQTAAAESGVKAMVPVGRPFLDYVLSALADAGFTSACLVVAPGANRLRDHYTRTLLPKRIDVSFAIQIDPLGTANAVLAAEEFAGPDEFLVINSDNYYPADVLRAVQGLGHPGAVLFEAVSLVRQSNIQEGRIRAFASCVVDSSGLLLDIIEKPGVGHFDAAKLVSMNCWRFRPGIFSACRDVPLSPRNEYELPLAVKLAIQRGMKLRTVISQSGVLDLSRRSDIAAVTERLKDVPVAL